MSIENIYHYGPAGGGKPQSMVIMLHGRGADGQDLLALAPFFASELPDTVFISPDAPLRSPFPLSGYEWFHLSYLDGKDLLPGIEEVAAVVEKLIAAQSEKYGVPPEKIALLGFSQGTMVALYAGPHYKDRLAGIVGYSGVLVWEDNVKPDSLQKIPVRLFHGEDDDILPVHEVHDAAERLKAAGFDVKYDLYPGLGHGINEDGAESGRAFLHEILGY